MVTRHTPAAFAKHQACSHFLGSLAEDRRASSSRDSQPARPNGASRNWTVAMELDASDSGYPREQEEKIHGRLPRTDGTRAFSFRAPRSSADEQGRRIVLLPEDSQVRARVWARRP